MNLAKARWILERRQHQSPPIIMYHGTAGVNVPRVMKTGLVPVPPGKRAWEIDPDAGFDRTSRTSLPSVYLTGNIITATGAAGYANMKKGGQHRDPKGLIIVQVVPRTLLADEDDIRNSFDLVWADQHHKLKEWSVLWLYAMHLHNGEDPTNSQGKRFYDSAKEVFIELVRRGIARELKVESFDELHPKMRDRILELAEEGFEAALIRKVSYVDPEDRDRKLLTAPKWDFKDATDMNIPKIPTQAEGEAVMTHFWEKATRTLKTIGAKTMRSFMKVARIPESIGFRGRNKIVGIVIIHTPLTTGLGQYLEIVYPRNGRLPADAKRALERDWKERIGEVRYGKPPAEESMSRHEARRTLAHRMKRW